MVYQSNTALYNRRALLYHNLMELVLYSLTIKTIISSLKISSSHKKILDLGCGSGISTRYLMKRFPKSSIIGFDLSPQMLALCHKKFPSIPLIEGNFNQSKDFRSYPQNNSINLKKIRLISFLASELFQSMET